MHRSSLRRVARTVVLSLVFTVGAYLPTVIPSNGALDGYPSAEAAPSKRAWLGVELANGASGGVVAKRVLRGSPADKAGVVAGDLLVSADGKDIESQRQLIEFIQDVGVGNESCQLKVHRGTDDKTIAVLLEEHPGDPEVLRRDKVGTFPAALKGAKPVTAGAETDFSKLKGRVVLIDFWAPWCVACRAATPALSDLSDKYTAQGLTVLGATSDPAETAGKAVKKFGMTYSVVSDVSDDTMSDYSVHALPTMFLVDKAGVIREVFVGFSDEKSIEDEVKPLLAEKAP